MDGDDNPLLDLLFGPEGLSCRLLVLRAVAEDNADPWPPLTFDGGNLGSDGTFTLDDPPAVSMVSYLRDRDVEIALRAERAPAELESFVADHLVPALAASSLETVVVGPDVATT